MAQKLRAVATLAQDLSSVSSTLSQGIQHTLLVSKGIRHTSGAQIYRQAKHPYTKNNDDGELQRKTLQLSVGCWPTWTATHM